MSLRSIRPLGTFRVNLTKDGEAHRRDGQTYVLLNDLGPNPDGSQSVEIMFEDGIWMLATDVDLLPS